MSAASQARRESIYWTTMEWNRICKALDEAYPDRTYKNATTASELPFALGEMNNVIKQALLPNRQRIIKDSYKFKKGLLAHLAHKDPAALRKDPVIWTDDEWRQLAIHLMQLQPEKHLLLRDNMECLKTADIEAAMEHMPEERRRSMHLGFMREKLAGIFTMARNEEDPAFMPKTEAPAPASAPEAPAAQAELPIEPPRKLTLKEIGLMPKTFWKLPEWVQIAEEIIRMSPKREAALLRGDLVSITSRDVKDAQLVLPENRRRNQALGDVARLRKNLAPAFEFIAKERRAAEQKANDEKAREARIETVEPPPPAVEAAPPPPPPEPAPEPTPEPARAAEFLPTAIPTPNPWETTFKPLMADLTTQFANAFGPLVQAAMAQGLQQAIMQGMQSMPSLVPQPPAPPPVAPPSTTPDAASQAAIDQFKRENPATTTSDNRPHVAVIGLIPQLGQELISTYPQLRLTVLDSETGLHQRQSFANADKVIGMTKFLSHKCSDQLAKHGERYTPVNGGLSSARHQIDVWIKSGALPGERRHEARAQ